MERRMSLPTLVAQPPLAVSATIADPALAWGALIAAVIAFALWLNRRR
jgi:hypothetical protein